MSASRVRYTVVVDRPGDWPWSVEGIEVIDADSYLARPPRKGRHPGRVINLCRRYDYLSGGYYCSLLAEARGEIPIPTVADILDLSRKSLYAFALPDLEATLARTIERMAEPPEDGFSLTVCFGRPDDGRFRKLAAEAFDVFRYPILRLTLRHRKGRWRVVAIRSIGPHRLSAPLKGFLEHSLRSFARLPGRAKPTRRVSQYDLAILVDPNETLPPSNPAALDRFVKAGRDLNMDVELITARDYHRIVQFDALFIRETTALDHHTFRFARKAETEGMPVIDDPTSILRCTNKVYLAESLAAKGLPAPRTIPVNRADFGPATVERLGEALGYPLVLKIPDGSFSRGVLKADGPPQALVHMEALFARSRLILAQEFMYTAYDWRVGVLNGRPLFACQYMMSRNHWQILHHRADGGYDEGGFKTFAVDEAPAAVIDVAVRAAALIGDGLYGVDLKENDDGVFVIEINDNPNLDHGIEDRVLKRELYREILRDFIRRVEAG